MKLGSWGARALALALLGAGCASYQGSARTVTPAALQADAGWQRIDDVPAVHQRGARDCGAAALSSVLGYWLEPAASAAFAAELRSAGAATAGNAQGLRAGALRDYARQKGLHAYVFHGTFADLQHELAAGRPVIVGVHKALSSREYLAHYEVVLGYHAARERVLTFDPAQGLREYPKRGFLDEWQRTAGTMLVIMP